MTRRTPAFDNVSVRVADENGQTKAWYPSVTAFISSVVTKAHNKYSEDRECNLCHEVYIGLAQDCRCTYYGYGSWREAPRDLRPWYWKWLP